MAGGIVVLTGEATVRRYRGKRDPWAVAMLAGTVVLTLAATTAVLMSPLDAVARVTIAAVLVGTGMFALLLLTWTHYDLGDGRLRAQHGLLRRVIPVKDIHAIALIHSLASSAVLSRDRIRVEYGHGRAFIEISPTDISAFLGDLRAMAPGIKVRGA